MTKRIILSTNQPYFFPFHGFFLKAWLSDIFVILDDVQFPRGTTWITRNRFKNDQGTLWMTIPVLKKGLGLQKINDVKIYHEGRWARKHLSSLKSAYGKAPYLGDHLEFLENIFAEKRENLIDLNMAIIRYLMKQLHLDTELLLLSELGIEARGDRLLVEICKKMGATHLLARKPARKYMKENLFHDAGVELKSFSSPSPVYPQLWGDYIANLSVFDLILNCGPKAHDILTGK